MSTDTPLPTGTLPPNTRVRHYPDATEEYLRYQVGEYVSRPLESPRYNGPVCVGHTSSTSRTVGIFHAIGWGSSLDAARAMYLAKTQPTRRRKNP
jgi:hypothetical protein